MENENIAEYRKTISNDELEQISKEYDNGEKIKSIIEKHKLTISVRQMSDFLPPKETEAECSYCGRKMYQKRKRSYWYKEEDTFCIECGHRIIPDYVRAECECEFCRQRRQKIKEIKRKKREEKAGIIYDNYVQLIPNKVIPFDELKFKYRAYIYLISLINDKYKDFTRISGRNLDGLTIQFMRSMINAEIAFVSPDSPIEGFLDKGFPYVYDETMVSYILNVSFSSKNMHTICNRVFSAEGVEEKEVQDFMHELIYFDLLKRFENILWEVHIRFEPTQEQLDRFYELIEKCSYTQCLYLFKKVSEWYIINITKGKVFKSKAPSQVLASVVNFYENAMNKGWEVYRRAPESASELMHFVIKKILKKEMSILDDVI